MHETAMETIVATFISNDLDRKTYGWVVIFDSRLMSYLVVDGHIRWFSLETGDALDLHDTIQKVSGPQFRIVTEQHEFEVPSAIKDDLFSGDDKRMSKAMSVVSLRFGHAGLQSRRRVP